MTAATHHGTSNGAPGRPTEGETMKVLGKPIDGVNDWLTEAALLFADAASSEARKFASIRALEQQAKASRDELRRAKEQLEAASQAVVAANEAVALLEQAPLPWRGRSNGSWAGSIALLVAALVALNIWPLALMFVAAAVALRVFFHNKASEELRQRSKQREALLDDAGRAGKAQDDNAKAHAALQRQCAQLLQASQAIKPQRVVRAIGRIHCPLTAVDFAGYTLAIDRSGLMPKVAVRLPDIATNPEAVAAIQRAVERAKNKPLLLQAASDQPTEVDELQGEERDLKAAVESFTDMLDAIPTIEERLALLRNGSGMVRAAVARLPAAAADPSPAAVLRLEDGSTDTAAVQRISDVARRLRAIGKNADRVLRGLYQDLGGVLTDYRDLRAEALDRLHGSLHQVFQRSEMAYVTCYCPKCNRVPAYLYHKLGIELERAHELPPTQLLSALQADPEVRERLVSDEKLVADISAAMDSIREIDANIVRWEADLKHNAEHMGAAINELRSLESRLQALRSQRVQFIDQFRARVRKALTGNERPLLELSRQARLYKDRDRETWTCGACNTVFGDPQVARMGLMLRIKDELMMPMWNHLWTEKDDFRKSELFRTNEQLQRLMEKEAGALRDVAEQYRADMRPVRENLILAATDATAKRDQLDSTVGSLEAMGMIPPEQRKEWMSRLATMTGGDLGALRKRAEMKETLLSFEPEAQMNRRVPALDPVNAFITPDALFRLGQAPAEPLRLRSSKDR